MEKLKRTPLYQEHLRLDAQMVDFAGWEMPVQYTSILDEHNTVRNIAGLFDVSHMGEIEITGPNALIFADYLVTNSVSGLKNGEICYTPMCNENGGVVDDLLVYRFSEDKILFVVNAANTDKDFEWVKKHSARFNVEVKNISSETAQLAFQGPRAEEFLQEIAQVKLSEIPFYHFTEGKVVGIDCIISRTGYTGEDGFELYTSPEGAVPLWRKILEIGAPYGVKPIGLGARDTLRFEACYMLYGNELNDEITPLEAGLKWTVKLDKDFIGKDKLLKQLENGLEYKLRGIELVEKGIPRHGYEVYADGEKIGWVSSGMLSPTLKKPVALAYLKKGYWKRGTEVEIKIRSKMVKAVVTKTPFYRGSVKSKG
ncbi:MULTISPECIES: glycine cleavage system aminomethyltransferase GcvT [Kosmotoga]|uniref:Aminomethyltransferase n=1 Tax=Kosmotoga olearia (strain ATCC BAA-1733 / DSM 21960 / TBF 19.5.1) TaxID=521045 RepID=C5CF47_KOSOT|nr:MULTISPECIES: glycine cleavage system aminomethyltransferase GcvT [Kosmotoga]ACR80312.1 glycine cleavage system T protein [Kosmotoga olearia TBF 19.5.1]MDI3523559.1 aminomethyltransferase [Kosmotoga sp.]MDK2953041.1 aminomethyltransferase [Kosmotoga sp.]OAA20244.1 glycine cleavage system protein T [Kosmotoga sp. DU53]